MKKPWLAFLLSLVLAGAGLAYAGRWRWAVINLIAALAVGVGGVRYLPASQLSWLEIVLPVTNGVIAQAVAQSRNAELKALQN